MPGPWPQTFHRSAKRCLSDLEPSAFIPLNRNFPDWEMVAYQLAPRVPQGGKPLCANAQPYPCQRKGFQKLRLLISVGTQRF